MAPSPIEPLALPFACRENPEAGPRGSGDAWKSVAFVSPKGGAGKTTAALLLALGLEAMGKRAALIDSDINKPLMHWAALPGKPERVSVHPAPTSEDITISLRE